MNYSIFIQIYNWMMKEYGPQGWWPLLELDNDTEINITKSGSLRGYHPGDYTYPRNSSQVFQVIVGAQLTQNTSWIQVEKALKNLRDIDALDPVRLTEIDINKLKVAIKPAGYFNQKSERLKIIAKWFIDLGSMIPTREELLSINGVGPETADSIILYAFKQPSFVVDAYTRRIVGNLKIIDEKAKYDDIKAIFEIGVKPDIKIYQEYHALLVEHAKRYYQKKTTYKDDPLLDKIKIWRKKKA